MMGEKIRFLTDIQLRKARVAISHAEADAECWEADDDPSAKVLRDGVEILKRLVKAHTKKEDSDE